MFSTIKRWWNKAIYEEYELTVWFKDQEQIIEGRKVHPHSKKIFKLKSISKRNPKHIKGKELDGNDFEIRTVQPFDYMIRKIY